MLIAGVLFSPPSHAELSGEVSKDTLAAELTFTNPTVAKGFHGRNGNWPRSKENEAALRKFYEAINRLKKEGRTDIARIVYNKGADKIGFDFVRVTYVDGWSFDVKLDIACLEVTPKYGTIAQWSANEARVQRDIFDVMASEEVGGLKPDRAIGGGHIHMGAQSTFGNNVKLFRNFLVDQANHNELGDGAMEQDHTNAAPFNQLSSKRRENFRKLIARADSGEFKKVRDLATAFVKEVLFDGEDAPSGRKIMANKFWQMNVLRMAEIDISGLSWKGGEAEVEALLLFEDIKDGERTAEWRALRAPESAADMLHDLELVQGRVNYLRTLTEPLAIRPEFLDGEVGTIEKRVKQFYEFIVQSGRNPADYVGRLPRANETIPQPAKWRQILQKLIIEDGGAVADPKKGQKGTPKTKHTIEATAAKTPKAKTASHPGDNDPATLGLRLTFTNDELKKTGSSIRSSENEAALKRLHQVLVDLKKGGRPDIVKVVWNEKGDHRGNPTVRVTYNDGWYFDVELDVGALAVKPRPAPMKAWRGNISRLQTDVFDLMSEKLRLRPDPAHGGGGILIGGESAFGDDVRLFANFLADQANHPELAETKPGKGRVAAPFGDLFSDQRRKFAALLADVEKKKIKSVKSLATAFVRDVLFEGADKPNARMILSARDWQLNVLRLAEVDTWGLRWDGGPSDVEALSAYDEIKAPERTAQWRALSAPASADAALKDLELVAGRLSFLRQVKGHLALSQEFLTGETSEPFDGAKRFHKFVRESGGSPADYSHHGCGKSLKKI